MLTIGSWNPVGTGGTSLTPVLYGILRLLASGAYAGANNNLCLQLVPAWYSAIFPINSLLPNIEIDDVAGNCRYSYDLPVELVRALPCAPAGCRLTNAPGDYGMAQ